MKFSKKTSMILAALILISMASGCGKGGKEVNGKINISVGNWPDETTQSVLDTQNKMRDEFMAEHPDINIIADTYRFDTKTYTMKAAANQLPTLYKTWFTEIKQIIKAGYAADITDGLKKHGFLDAINPELMNLVKDDNGRYYGLPTDAYAQGLYINKKLFKEAGLAESDGRIKIPNTYDELAEYAKIVTEKTGAAGFAIPTTNNCGGWHFLNIAWAFGTEFEKQNDEGKWEATFDTEEARNALQYVKDLKWKYNVLPSDTVIDQQGLNKLFATNQAAMIFCNPPSSVLSMQYGMEIDDIFAARMPEGPKGRFSQMGGNLWMFSNAATPEQIDAGLTWIEYTGFSPKISDKQLDNMRESYIKSKEQNEIILDQDAFAVWVDQENISKTRALKAEFTNVNHDDYADYYSFEGVTINPEPSACAQQLYAVLDKCIQEVITNENADVDALITEANKDFQLNHLDKQ